MNELTGRAGLARILGQSESTTRNLQRRGLVLPECVIDGRPMFSIAAAMQLKEQRDRQGRKTPETATK
jgi:hypothetical protein